MKKIVNRYLPIIIGKYINALSYISLEKATLKTAYIFAKPRKGKVMEHQHSFLEQAKSTTITHQEYTIQTYHWTGNDKTILLAHGWESNSFRWRKLIKELQQKGYSIISIDAPAHGNSSGKLFNVPLYVECLEKVIKTHAPEIIIGHSLGGMTAIYHQFKYPDLFIKKLVILAAPSELSRIMKDYQRILRLNSKVIKNLETYYINRFGFSFSEFSTAKFSEELTQKGLIIHDEEDTIAPVEESISIHDHWKNSIFIKTNGLGHSLQDKKVYRHILEFIAN